MQRNSSLILYGKSYNFHWLVDHSPQVSPYSTALIEIRIVIVLLVIDLWVLFNHKGNKQSSNLILVVHFHHLVTIMHFSSIHRNVGILFAWCHSTSTSTPLLLEVYSLWMDLTTLPTKLFPPPPKHINANNIIKSWSGFASTGKELITHCYISPSTSGTECSLFWPLTTIVNKSARLSSELICLFNDISIVTDLWMKL